MRFSRMLEEGVNGSYTRHGLYSALVGQALQPCSSSSRYASRGPGGPKGGGISESAALEAAGSGARGRSWGALWAGLLAWERRTAQSRPEPPRAAQSRPEPPRAAQSRQARPGRGGAGAEPGHC